MNNDGMTLVELLAEEPSLSLLNGGKFVNPNSTSESQPYIQRQTSAKLSVKKIHRPSSVPSTKKFEDYGVSTLNKRRNISH